MHGKVGQVDGNDPRRTRNINIMNNLKHIFIILENMALTILSLLSGYFLILLRNQMIKRKIFSCVLDIGTAVCVERIGLGRRRL